MVVVVGGKVAEGQGGEGTGGGAAMEMKEEHGRIRCRFIKLGHPPAASSTLFYITYAPLHLYPLDSSSLLFFLLFI